MELRAQAAKCRDLASDCVTSEARVILLDQAMRFDEDANHLDSALSRSPLLGARKWQHTTESV
jgi:hypothetical protein